MEEKNFKLTCTFKNLRTVLPTTGKSGTTICFFLCRLGLGPYLLTDFDVNLYEKKKKKIIIKVDQVNLRVPRNKLFMAVACLF
jgi:hypothetical protein